MIRSDRADWPEQHEVVWREYENVIGFGFDQEREQNQNRGALHRLAHLVPETIEDQESLAYILAELVLWAVLTRMEKPDHELALEMLAEAHELELEGQAGYQRLVDLIEQGEPWKRRIAWNACALLTLPEHRARLEHDGKEYRKIIKPIPDPVSTLMAKYFRGEVKKPSRPAGKHDPAKRPFFDGAIVFMVHAASESGLKPTRNEATETTCAVDVVTDVLHKHEIDDRKAETITAVWQRRSKSYREPLNLIPR